jgi:hypothetical protein
LFLYVQNACLGIMPTSPLSCFGAVPLNVLLSRFWFVNFGHPVYVPSRLRNKSDSQVIYDIARFCANASVPERKNGRSSYEQLLSTWPEIMCQGASDSPTLVGIFRLCWLNMQNKQTTVIRQENITSHKANVWRQRDSGNRKPPVLWENSLLWEFRGRVEYQFRKNHHLIRVQLHCWHSY